MEAIILAGGYGTRLRSVVKDVPKPMAMVRGRPFLCYVLDWLNDKQVDHVVLATGYKKEVIMDYFGEHYGTMDISYSTEDEPLGTGGAIGKAFAACRENDVFVVNGDTLFRIELAELKRHYNGCFCMGLAISADPSRYGFVKTRKDLVVGFQEKGGVGEGYINGGVYLAARDVFSQYTGAFSLEKEVFPRLLDNEQIVAVCSDAYFIDIGIPEDYERANMEL